MRKRFRAECCVYEKTVELNATSCSNTPAGPSCLTLILACIIYWQAKQTTQTVPSGAVAEEGIDATLLQHVSPIEWDNVILWQGRPSLGKVRVEGLDIENAI